MYFKVQRPSPTLAACIDYYWYLSDMPRHAREYIAPSGTVEVVINLHEDEIRIYDRSDLRRVTRYSGAVVSGAQRSYFVIDSRAHASIIGVHFKPGGGFPFFPVSSASLSDRHVDLEALWGAHATDLRERLCAARNLTTRFKILEHEIVQRFNSTVPRRSEVRLALDQLSRTDARIGHLATEVALSHRRLIQIFTAEVGLKPKVFSRVVRFQRALALAKQQVSPDWAQLALACGYFDQSHLVRDFGHLSGLAPVDLLRSSAGVKEHHAALLR